MRYHAAVSQQWLRISFDHGGKYLPYTKVKKQDAKFHVRYGSNHCKTRRKYD
jgi:hypothetical protein